ncbi:MAG: DUF3303 domain-containing protein [bacterium]
MLVMVIERFKKDAIDKVGERYRAKGRMMPDGVAYVSSWLDDEGTICYQLMEAPAPAALKPWTDAWDDLMDFELVPVSTSAEFWAKRAERGAT